MQDVIYLIPLAMPLAAFVLFPTVLRTCLGRGWRRPFDRTTESCTTRNLPSPASSATIVCGARSESGKCQRRCRLRLSAAVLAAGCGTEGCGQRSASGDAASPRARGSVSAAR